MPLGKDLKIRLRTREESAVVGLTKKLEKETKRRNGAERDAANWKKKYSGLEKPMDYFYCECCYIEFGINSIKRKGRQVYCPLCLQGLIPHSTVAQSGRASGR